MNAEYTVRVFLLPGTGLWLKMQVVYILSLLLIANCAQVAIRMVKFRVFPNPTGDGLCSFPSIRSRFCDLPCYGYNLRGIRFYPGVALQILVKLGSPFNVHRKREGVHWSGGFPGDSHFALNSSVINGSLGLCRRKEFVDNRHSHTCSISIYKVKVCKFSGFIKRILFDILKAGVVS